MGDKLSGDREDSEVTWEGRGGDGGEKVAGEVQLHQVCEAAEGRGINLTNLAMREFEFLKI